MTATKDTARAFYGIIPKSFVYSEGFRADVVKKFIDVLKKKVKQNKEFHAFLILDDVAFDKSIFKSKDIRELSFNGRHQRITVFITSQYATVLPPDIRSNIDYVFCLRDNIRNSRKKLYEYFFGQFDSFQDFSKVLTVTTRDYGVLVLDRTNPTGDLDKCMFHYKANLRIKQHRLGNAQHPPHCN
eukprot:jgi/Bigna1/134233/aug1.24_g8941